MDTMEEHQPDHLGWRTLAILSGLGLIVMFGETMVLPAIPDFIRDFNITYNTSSWILSAYIISGAVMTPIAGKLSDIYGKKKMLLLVMAIYAAGVISASFATNIEFMIAARIAQGVGMSMFPIAFAIIREVLPEKRLAIGQTIFSSTFSGGGLVGLVVGAAIIQNFGWQGTFLTLFPIAVALWLIIVRYVRTGYPASMDQNIASKTGGSEISIVKKIDIRGTLALAATITTFLLGVSTIESKGDGTYYLLGGFFAISAASLAAFVVIERRAEAPLIDLKLMVSKLFLPPVVILMLVSMSMFMVYQTIPIMVRSPVPLGFGGEALDSARVQLPFMIVSLTGTVASGFLLSKVGNTKLLIIGTIVSTVGFLSLVTFHSSEYAVSSGLAIIGAGFSLSLTGAFNIILVSVPMRVTGIALGIAVLLNLVGSAVGPSIAGQYQQANQATVEGVSGSFPTENAYNLIFITAILISLVSVAMALPVVKRRKQKEDLPSSTDE